MRNIAFIGQLRQGKTSAALHLERGYGYTRRCFADGVKDMTISMLDAAGKYLIDQNNDSGAKTLEMTRQTLERYKQHPSMRRFIQTVGTELGRNFYGPEDIWIKMLTDNLNENERTVVDDCRYPDEAEALKKHGFMIIRVHRDMEAWQADLQRNYTPDDLWQVLNHPSESLMKDYKADWDIYADDGLSNLHQAVDDLMLALRRDSPLDRRSETVYN